MLEKLAKDNVEKYQTFWKQFGLVLKEGPAEDHANQEGSPNCCALPPPIPTSAQTVSLEDYGPG